MTAGCVQEVFGLPLVGLGMSVVLGVLVGVFTHEIDMMFWSTGGERRGAPKPEPVWLRIIWLTIVCFITVVILFGLTLLGHWLGILYAPPETARCLPPRIFNPYGITDS